MQNPTGLIAAVAREAASMSPGREGAEEDESTHIWYEQTRILASLDTIVTSLEKMSKYRDQRAPPDLIRLAAPSFESCKDDVNEASVSDAMEATCLESCGLDVFSLPSVVTWAPCIAPGAKASPFSSSATVIAHAEPAQWHNLPSTVTWAKVLLRGDKSTPVQETFRTSALHVAESEPVDGEATSRLRQEREKAKRHSQDPGQQAGVCRAEKMTILDKLLFLNFVVESRHQVILCPCDLNAAFRFRLSHVRSLSIELLFLQTCAGSVSWLGGNAIKFAIFSE